MQTLQPFFRFWMGAGSWVATPPQRKPAIAESVVNVEQWAHALFREPAPLDAFARLDIPILYMLGERSPESAQAVARVLIPSLPRATTVRFPDLGHMAPVTHPEVINAVIEQFLITASALDRTNPLRQPRPAAEREPVSGLAPARESRPLRDDDALSTMNEPPPDSASA